MDINVLLVFGLLAMIGVQIWRQDIQSRQQTDSIKETTKVISDLHKAIQVQNDTFKTIIEHIISNQ